MTENKTLMEKIKQSLTKSPREPEKFLILQWGKERSIITLTSSIDNPVLIVDNDYLMYLDEQGLILF